MLEILLKSLSRPGAYPYPVESIEIHQTHISAVFLAGAFAYKIKKPVNLGFLDFTTLEKRRHFCEEEVRLNRRLAPEIYLGVVPVCRDETGLHFEGFGEPVEWVVKMVRLPAEATLEGRLARGEVLPEQIEALGRRLATFHREAEGGDRIAAFGRFEVVAKNVRENFSLSLAQVGVTVRAAVFDRIQQLTEQQLAKHSALIEARARRGVPRDTHGDLHLDHFYVFPERPPPGDLVIIDCIEFNERYRFADPVADMAFPVMDLAYHGRRDLAKVVADAYFECAEDGGGRALLPLYTSYRAAVRAKVEGMKSLEKEVSPEEREQARLGAGAHWLLALAELETPSRRPALILIAGLPGTGKSMLARLLAERFDAVWLRSDVIRKELNGQIAVGAPSQDLYSSACTERTYREMLHRAEQSLSEGRRVIVDANFPQEQQRKLFLILAKLFHVPCFFFHCQARPEVVADRLRARRGDPSDADWDVYQRLAATWEPMGSETLALCHAVDCNGTPQEIVHQAVAVLSDAELI